MRRIRRKSATPATRHPWYLKEWMQHFKKKQAHLIRDLDWQRSTASEVWNGRQRYTQDMIDELAEYLHLRPFELLLPPEEAMAIRRMREAAVRIAADNQPEPAADAPQRAAAG